jgi:hypothetical protein
VLFDCIGNMAKRYCFSHLLQMSFVDHCIEMVICHYIEKSLYSLEANEARLLPRKKYFLTVEGCKEHSEIKSRKRCCDEMYLGKSSFPDELLRSFHEFMAVVVHTFGFLPKFE